MAFAAYDLVDPDDGPATKNGSQTVYKIPVSYVAGSPIVKLNGISLKPVDQTEFDGSSAERKRMLSIIDGSAVTLGLAPVATDDLWVELDEA